MDNKETLIKLGKNIRKYRKLKNYTQAMLAEKINKHESTIARIEIGTINSSTIILCEISKALDVKLKQFFDFS